jgi:MFS transporter, PPP family, 3-phenylpropionic acid transporter
VRGSFRAWSKARPSAAVGLSLYFGCLFAGAGVTMPYLNPWMASRGITVDQLATIASATAITRMFAGPLVGFLADWTGAHRRVLIIAAWAWFGAWLLLVDATAFGHFMIGHILIALTGAALMPLADAMTLAGMRAGLMDYGRVRLWGSATFLVATLFGGALVARYGLEIVIGYVVLATLATALSAMLLPAMTVASGPIARPRLADGVTLVTNPIFARFLFAAGLAQASHATLYVFSTLHWQTQGISPLWCGILWAIGVASEIALFWFGTRLPAALTPLRLLMIGLAAGVLRWSLMGFDPPLAVLVPLQVLHGATFAAAHLGAMQFISRAIPPSHAGTAQSVYALASGGIGMALATQIAGTAYQAASGRAYLAMGLLSAIGLVICLSLARRWDGALLNAMGSQAAGRE